MLTYKTCVKKSWCSPGFVACFVCKISENFWKATSKRLRKLFFVHLIYEAAKISSFYFDLTNNMILSTGDFFFSDMDIDVNEKGLTNVVFE